VVAVAVAVAQHIAVAARHIAAAVPVPAAARRPDIDAKCFGN